VLSAALAVAVRLAAVDVPWLLSGSAGRAFLGFSRRPRDVDVEVPEESIHRAARALGATPAFREDTGRSGWRATTSVRGVEVDLSAGLTVARVDGRPPLRADFELEEEFASAVALAGRTIRIAPVEEQMAVAIVSADWARLARTVAGAPAGFRPRPAYFERRLAAAPRAAS